MVAREEWSYSVRAREESLEVSLELSTRVEDARTNSTSHPTGVAAPPLAGDAEDPLRKPGSQSARPYDGWHVEHVPLETSIDDGQFEVIYGEDVGMRKSKLNTTETTDETEISLASEGSSNVGFGPSQYMRRVRRRRNTFIFCMFVPFAASAISFALLLSKQERLANREAELAVAIQSGVSSIEEELSRDEPHQNEDDDDTRNDGVDIESQSVNMEETIGPSLMSSDGPSAPPSSTPSLAHSLEPTYLPTRDPTTRPTSLPTQKCVASGSPCPNKKEDVQCCSNECVDGTSGKGGSKGGGKGYGKGGNIVRERRQERYETGQ